MSHLKHILSIPTLLVLSVFLSETALGLYTPALPYIAQYFKISNDLAQLTFSAGLLGFGIGSLTHGPISDVFGRRTILLFSFVIFTVATFACASAHSIYGLIIARLFQGYGVGAAPIIALAVIRDYYPPQQANRFMALMGGVIALAPAIAPSIGGILTEKYGWRSCFYILLWFSTILLPLLWSYMPETLKQSGSENLTLQTFFKDLFVDTCALLKNIYFLNVVAISSLMVACIWLYAGVAPFAFQLMGVSPIEFGFYYGITVSGYIIGSFINSMFGYKLGFRNMLLVGFGFIIVFSIILLTIDFVHFKHPLIISICVALHSFGLAFIFPVTNTLAMKIGTKGGLTASILNGLEIFISTIAVMSISVEDPENFIYIALIRFIICVIAFIIYKLGLSKHLSLTSTKD